MEFSQKKLQKNFIQDACDAMGIVGDGVKKKMNLHSLRSKVITQMFQSSLTDYNVLLQPGHRSNFSLCLIKLCAGNFDGSGSAAF